MKTLYSLLLSAAVMLGGAGDAFAQAYGYALAIGDEELIVGEPLNDLTSGFVYVYRRGPQADWVEHARLAPTGAENGNYFGRSIALQGNTMFIGSTVADSSTGAVYLFQKDAAGEWRQMTRFQPADVEQGDALGKVTVISGDLAASAAWGHEPGGGVWVFRRDASGNWSEDGTLVGSDTGEGDAFGGAMDIRGERIVIGAPFHDARPEAEAEEMAVDEGDEAEAEEEGGEAAGQDENVVDDAGAAYVFERDASGNWTQTAKLSIEGLSENSFFGWAVAFDGEDILVGAPGGNQFTGTVYRFSLDEESSEWEQGDQLQPFDGPRFGWFGSSLALTGNEVWVGARSAHGQEGRIYRFSRDGEGMITGVTTLAAAEPEGGERFAESIAVRGNLALVGLLGDDYGAGTVVVLERGSDWNQSAKIYSKPGAAYGAVVGGKVDCTDGEAGSFACRDVDLLSFLPVTEIGGGRGVRTNDVWGWTDPQTGREYALVGMSHATSFIDISDPANPVALGILPRTEGSPGSTWRDIKVYKDHAFIVSDGAGAHGVQIFDLTQLRNVRNAPVTFEETAHYDGIFSAHNIVINEESGFAYSVGSNGGGETCGGGLHMIDIRTPDQPTFAGCFADITTGNQRTGYSHDAMCVNYRGPDSDYAGREICFGSNETALSIADVSDKKNPVAISVANYPNVGYAHQGWITEDHRYFLLDDEGDEFNPEFGLTGTRTIIWDIEDLDDPVLVKEYIGPTFTSDHNLYVKGDYAYQSNYVSGLRILDIRDPENPKEVAFFDTVPYDESPGFNGSWSNYPFFESGTIVVTSGREGVFFLRKREALTP